MMETATMSHSSLLDSHSPPPPNTSSKVGNHRDLRTPRFCLDAFHSPSEFSSRANGSRHSSAAQSRSNSIHEDSLVSPTAMPVSFNSLRDSAHDLNQRIGKSPGTSPGLAPSSPSGIFRGTSDRNPALTIRRAPSGASLSKDIEHLRLDENSPPKDSGRRHHRRRRTGSLSDSPPRRQSLTEDMLFPATVDDIHECDEGHCSNHHHRQSSSSIVSIKCDRSDDDNDSTHAMEHIEGEIEATIPMAPMAPLMLVPLIDRPVEMAELIEHYANKRWVNQVKHTVGDDVYKNQCLPLWTETGRNKLPDIAWLKRSKDLLVANSCGGNRDPRLWSEFCDMVGWSEGEIELEEENRRPSSSPRRHGSQDGNISPQMKCIVEEED